MLTVNPFVEIHSHIPVIASQIFVVVMVLLVVLGTIFDVLHKKSARYFFEASKKAAKAQTREVDSGEKVGVAFKTIAHDVLASGEFCNTRRRVAHLLSMYGFVLFVVTTAVMVFAYPTDQAATPAVVPILWHLGALLVCVGGYWFWFRIRVDVAAEGNPWYRVVRADLFVLSLLATTSFALIWSVLQAAGAGTWGLLFFALFIFSATLLFGGVPWSKFAHMFFKPAAAYQRRLGEADGSRQNLPQPADKPKQFGLGIRREAPRHY
jgi:hypothetical protein